jgi:hypothetical protein
MDLRCSTRILDRQRIAARDTPGTVLCSSYAIELPESVTPNHGEPALGSTTGPGGLRLVHPVFAVHVVPLVNKNRLFRRSELSVSAAHGLGESETLGDTDTLGVDDGVGVTDDDSEMDGDSDVDDDSDTDEVSEGLSDGVSDAVGVSDFDDVMELVSLIVGVLLGVTERAAVRDVDAVMDFDLEMEAVIDGDGVTKFGTRVNVLAVVPTASTAHHSQHPACPASGVTLAATAGMSTHRWKQGR